MEHIFDYPTPPEKPPNSLHTPYCPTTSHYLIVSLTHFDSAGVESERDKRFPFPLSKQQVSSILSSTFQ